MRLADYRLKIPWVCCCITCHTWPNFTYALLSLLIVSLSHFCISHFRICSSLIHSSPRFSSLRVEIHHHLKKTMKKSTKKIMEEYSIPDGEKKLDAALKGSVIPEWRKIRLHFYKVNHDKFVGLVPNSVYFIHTFRKSVDKNKIFFPSSYQLLNLYYYKEIPQFFEELDMECDHGASLDVTNAVFDDCSFWTEPEYLVGDKFKWLHVESLKDLEEAIKGFQLDVKSMSKFIDKVHRNRALKNLGLESLSSVIDDDSKSEGDDVEVGPVDDEGIKKMYEVFDDRETLLNRCKDLMELIKKKLKGLNGAVCLPPQDGVVERDAPESVFNIMKTTGTGGAQPQIATSEVDEPKVKFKERDSMVGALVNPKKPFAAIIGGSKMSSKIGLIEPLLAKLDILVLGGGTVFTFYKAQGFSVGSSFVEEDKLDLANSLLEKAKVHNVLILFPTDLVIADKYAADANSKIVPVSSIPDGWMGLDIGPDSVSKFSETLDEAVTVIWNGPMGVVEFEKFAVGTKLWRKLDLLIG